MVPIEMSAPHSYSTSIHTIGLACTVWPQYTTRQTDRQTDRAIGIDWSALESSVVDPGFTLTKSVQCFSRNCGINMIENPHIIAICGPSEASGDVISGELYPGLPTGTF